jgi:hypothetical protein
MSNRVEPFIQCTHMCQTDFTYDADGNCLTFNCRSGDENSKIVGRVQYAYDVNGNVTLKKFVKVD